jgi:hypothetical protein
MVLLEIALSTASLGRSSSSLDRRVVRKSSKERFELLKLEAIGDWLTFLCVDNADPF